MSNEIREKLWKKIFNMTLMEFKKEELIQIQKELEQENIPVELFLKEAEYINEPDIIEDLLQNGFGEIIEYYFSNDKWFPSPRSNDFSPKGFFAVSEEKLKEHHQSRSRNE